ncbi:MAG TPA: class I SAM-dependent methyltransferase [Chitinophagales bacterium]|nr:class I SAM-dependent methyltransferase [Chitinophagales bacterium]
MTETEAHTMPKGFKRWQIAQWFELRWWNNYLYGKNKTAYLNWKRGYWNKILTEIGNHLQLNSSKTVLDLGCGPAGIFIALPHNPVTAVDPLLDKYAAQTPFFNKEEYPNTSFVTAMMEDYEGPPFDIVFCLNAINHVRDMGAAFDTLRAHCKAGGTIVVTIDAHNYALAKHLFRLVPGDILHPHQYDLAEYKNYTEKDGWQISLCQKLKHEFLFDHYLLVAKKH